MAVEGCFQWTNRYACTAKWKCQLISPSSGSQTTYCWSISISELELGCPPLGSQEDLKHTGHWALKGWTQRQVLQAQPPSASQPQGQCMAIIYALFFLDTTNESASYWKKSLRWQLIAATRQSQRQFRVNNWKLAESDPCLCWKTKLSRLGCISAALEIAFGFLWAGEGVNKWHLPGFSVMTFASLWAELPPWFLTFSWAN